MTVQADLCWTCSEIPVFWRCISYPLSFPDLNIEDHPVHVLTTVLKCFFRELPEPLLTFELYDEFLQASGKVRYENRHQVGLNMNTGSR